MVPMFEVVEHDAGPDTSLVSVVETAEQRDEDDNGNAFDDSLLPGLPDDLAMQCLARTSIPDYASLACLNRRFKSVVRSGDLYRLRTELEIFEHWIFIRFASNSVESEAFNPEHQRWMRLPKYSDDCFNKDFLAVGTELLIFDRESTGFAMWRYSVSTHKWSRGPPMTFPCHFFGSSNNGEMAIVAGGLDKLGVALKSAELYNSELGTWEALPEMHLGRRMCSGFFMDGKFYVIGGFSSNHEYLTCGEEYNLQERTWTRIPDMYHARHARPLVAVVNNELYAVGYSRNEVEKYNKETNSWRVLGCLPSRACSRSSLDLAFTACGNELIVIAGQGQCGPEGKGIVLYSWQPTSEERPPEWRVLGIKANVGMSVLYCGVMGC